MKALMDTILKRGLGLALCGALLGTGAFATTGTNVPNITYSVSISSPTDGETYEKDSGQTGSASAEKDEDGTITDITSDISWSGDVSGSGGTSSDFTTSSGSKSLTASAETASDSVSVHIAEMNTFRAIDSNTVGSAGTRKADSGETLVMVYSNSDRSVDLRFAYTTSSSSGSDYPKWSGNWLQSPSDGDMAASFKSGITDAETVTLTYANGSTSTVSIKVIDYAKTSVKLSTNEGWGKTIKEKSETVIKSLFGDDSGITGNGEVKFETKYVDFYGDGSKGGHFIKIEGTFSVSAGAAEAKSPDFPTPLPGVFWYWKVGTNGLTFNLAGSGTLDESLQSPGVISAQGSLNTTFSITGGVTAGKVVSINVAGQVKIDKSATVSFSGGKIEGSGSVGIDSPQVTVTADLDLGLVEISRELGRYKFNVAAKQDFGPATIYQFPQQ